MRQADAAGSIMSGRGHAIIMSGRGHAINMSGRGHAIRLSHRTTRPRRGNAGRGYELCGYVAYQTGRCGLDAAMRAVPIVAVKLRKMALAKDEAAALLGMSVGNHEPINSTDHQRAGDSTAISE